MIHINVEGIEGIERIMVFHLSDGIVVLEVAAD
jgi:hypothetical protein